MTLLFKVSCCEKELPASEFLNLYKILETKMYNVQFPQL